MSTFQPIEVLPAAFNGQFRNLDSGLWQVYAPKMLVHFWGFNSPTVPSSTKNSTMLTPHVQYAFLYNALHLHFFRSEAISEIKHLPYWHINLRYIVSSTYVQTIQHSKQLTCSTKRHKHLHIEKCSSIPWNLQPKRNVQKSAAAFVCNMFVENLGLRILIRKVHRSVELPTFVGRQLLLADFTHEVLLSSARAKACEPQETILTPTKDVEQTRQHQTYETTTWPCDPLTGPLMWLTGPLQPLQTLDPFKIPLWI